MPAKTVKKLFRKQGVQVPIASISSQIEGTTDSPSISFFRAVQDGDLAKTQSLLDSQPGTIIVQSRDAANATALHYAAYGGYADICALLIDRGAEVNGLGGKYLSTPIQWAVLRLVRKVQYECCSYETLDVLLRRGADPTIQDRDGRVPLRAIMQTNPRRAIFTQLLERLPCKEGNVPNVEALKDSEGQTLLMRAVSVGSYVSASLLLDFKADVCTVDNEGATALHHAIKGGNRDCILLLLQHKAQINALDKQGRDAFQVAAACDPPELVFTATDSAIKGSSPSQLLSLRDNDAQIAFYILDQMLEVSKDADIINLRRLSVKLARVTQIIPLCLHLDGKTVNTSNQAINGGYGIVRKAEYLGKQVATKSLKEGERRDAFLQEAVIWKHLKHTHVLEFYGIERVSPDDFWIVSPWMEHGHILKYIRYLNEMHLQVSYLKLLCEVADGLKHLHNEGVIHGDLRSPNILIDSKGSVKLSDFGLAVLNESTSTTVGPQLARNVRWLSPEILKEPNRKPDTACDIYSFACLCIEIYSGVHPYSQVLSSEQVVTLVLSGNRPARPQELGSDPLWNLIQQCWHESSNMRPNAEYVYSQLDDLYRL